MRILAIETSCDETAIAIAEFSGPISKPKVRILSNITSSQVKHHAPFGGVVPNLAKREHQRNLVPILLAALKGSGLLKQGKSDFPLEVGLPKIDKMLVREPELLKQFKKRIVPLAPPKIDAIAVTYGPGLAPALWVGVNFARALAYLWKKPLIPVDHMAGHLYSAILQKSPKHEARNPKQIQNSKSKIQNRFEFRISNFEFPAMALLVSGGHTELVLMRGYGKFKIIGETLDDAAGEAFDKVARILGLGYPGGPEISRLAERLKSDFNGFEVGLRRVKLPRPMINTKDYNFSFSGLKTAVLYLVRDLGPKRSKKNRPLIAKEFQDAVVKVLVKKTVRAAKEYKVKTVLLGGGVAANKLLRQKLSEACQVSNVICQMSYVSLTGDNALMIALAAHFQWASLAPKGRAAYFSGKKNAWSKVHADANARLS